MKIIFWYKIISLFNRALIFGTPCKISSAYWKLFYINWAMACVFQQCGILTSVDSDKPVQPPFKLRNSKWCGVSSLILIEYSCNYQRLWSDCVYAQADLRLCWLHIPHCWKSHATAQLVDWMRLTLVRWRFILISLTAISKKINS